MLLGMDLEIEPPQGQAADDRKAFPVEGLVQHRGFARACAQVRTRVGRVLSPLSSIKTMVRLCCRAFFLMQTILSAASGGSPFHPVPPPRRSGRWQLKPLAPSKRQT